MEPVMERSQHWENVCVTRFDRSLVPQQPVKVVDMKQERNIVHFASLWEQWLAIDHIIKFAVW
jgi:hypothetical protein